MSTRTKTLTKSLHTVSVIVNVARYMLASSASVARSSNPEQQAVDAALRVLGYGDAADPYGLATTALKQLEKETSK